MNEKMNENIAYTIRYIYIYIILYRPFLARSPESKVFPAGYSFPSFQDALHIAASAITEISKGDGQNMRVLPWKLNTRARRLRRRRSTHTNFR